MMSSIRFYAGLFLVTACTLMLQVIQTRILSVVAWYHLAFFAISMAMFGLTAGAVWIYLRRERFGQKTLSHDLAYHSAAFAVSTGLCLMVQMTLSPVVSRAVASVLVWAEMALCLAVPFFFSGVVVTLALTRSPFPIGRVYGVDLLGAALGCLGVLLILSYTDGPSAVLWIAAVAALAAVLFSGSAIGTAPNRLPPFDAVLRHRKTIFALLALGAFANGLTGYGLQPLVSKGAFEGGNSFIFREWNTFSRVAVYATVEKTPSLWGPSPRFAGNEPVWAQRYLNIDGDAGTMAYRFRGDLKDVDFLRYDITNLAYHLPGRARVAVIGVGGGRDILSAALFGSRDITGVEINPIFVKLLTRQPGFAGFTNLQRLEGVKFVVDEGRSWFARTGQAFDLIQMSLIDTWAATGAGAFSLSENGLYTVEATRIFLSRLTPAGVFSVSRWYREDDPSETGRLLSLAMAALMDIGVDEPKNHIFLATQGHIATLIVGRRPFSPADLEALNNAAGFYSYRVLVGPAIQSDVETLRRIVAARGRRELDEYTSHQNFDLTPATDNRPFFFNQVPMNKPIQALYMAKSLVGKGTGKGGVRQGNLVATATLLLLFLVSLALVLAAIVVPLRSAIADAGRKLVIGGTLYFLLIGIGFMAVEIGLLQRMSVFLGHPIYSLSVSLFTLISTTGIGSLLSDKLVLNTRTRFVGWALLTGGYISSMPVWLPLSVSAFEGSPIFTRAAICVAIIAPAGLLMGFAFATGMRYVSAIDRRPAPWFWGINGAAGVLASVMAIACNIALGIGATISIGAACYLLLIPTVLAVFWRPEMERARAVSSES